MMCLNKKMLMGVGVLVLGVLVIAPGRTASMLPALLMLLCPLSMLLMMRAGAHGPSGAGSSRRDATNAGRGPADVDRRTLALQAELRTLKETQAVPAEGQEPLGTSAGGPSAPASTG